MKAVPPPVEEVKIPEIIPERIPDKEMAPQPPTTIDVAPQLEEGMQLETWCRVILSFLGYHIISLNHQSLNIPPFIKRKISKL